MKYAEETMNENKTKRAIVILASGRTGSSLLMQILHRLGMSVSAELTSASEQNVMGGYEDRNIFEIQTEFLRILKTNQYLPLPENWRQNPAIKAKKDQLSTIIQDEISKLDTIWGFKDPRTVLFLPLWIQIFNSLKLVPRYVLAVRSPQASVISYSRQYNHSKELSELFWLHKNCSALHHTGGNCYIVHYEDWFTQPYETAQGLLKYTGIDQYFTGNVDEALKEVIKPNLNRAVHGDYEVQNGYVLKLYDVLKQCRGDGFDRTRLMDAVMEVRRVMNGFKGWYLETQNQKYQLSKASEEELSAIKTKHERSVQEKDKRISDMEQNLQKITLQNNEYLKQIKDLQDETESLRVKLISAPKLQKQLPPQNYSRSTSVDKLEQKLSEVHNSYSYRLGQVFVSAVARPGKNTFMLPFRFLKIVFEFLFFRK
jgi:hypothetical protein